MGKQPGRWVPIELPWSRLDLGGQSRIELVSSQAFIPDPLPPSLDWCVIRGGELFGPLSEAMGVMGRLEGLLVGTPDSKILLRSLWMREAKLSSKIEDVHTTGEEMVLAGAGRPVRRGTDAQQAWNYVEALEHGVDSNLPICTRLICQMHKILLQRVRGEKKRPGCFRDGAVYIGDPQRGPASARFVPPPAEKLEQCMRDFEVFANSGYGNIPEIFAIALMHYQFEAIHPFRDGNGRIGRVLVARSLVREGLLTHPVVYVSAYIEKTKQRYVDLLRGVSEDGAWEPWLAYMTEAIRTQAQNAVHQCEGLIGLRHRFHESLKEHNAQGRQFRLVDRLFSMPVINVREAVSFLGVSDPTARKDIRDLESLGILREITGQSWGQDWIAPDIVSVLDDES